MTRSKTCPPSVLCTRCGQFGLFSQLSNGALSAVCSACLIDTTHSGMHAETPIDGPPLAKKPRRPKPKPSPNTESPDPQEPSR